MGVEISKVTFSEDDKKSFNEKLREETKVLMKWFEEEQFEKVETLKCGLEVEAWLSDQNNIPTAQCEDFINKVNDKDIVPEISKFNFEINTPVLEVKDNVISQLHDHLKSVWKKCEQNATKDDRNIFMIGSLPTVSNKMLTLENLYPNKRYFALNDQILKFRKNQPLTIDIEGKEHLKVSHQDVMLEAAATSVQFHLQIPLNESVDYYNCSLLASPFIAALGANSPFLFGKSLWDESRVPIFEQSICMESFQRLSGRKARRVSLGSGYVKKSIFEIFLENLDGYSPLLPLCYDDKPENMKHLCLHNGTIWRWNRPIIGIDKNNNKSLRLEHRVPSSGPTPIDIVGNMFAYIGIVTYLKNTYPQFTEEMNFEYLRKLFYDSCKEGYKTRCKWFDNQIYSLDEILLNELLPGAQKALKSLNVNANDVDWLFNSVLLPRVKKRTNGSLWQREYVNSHGKKFTEMLDKYYQYQSQNIPVHKWEI